MKNLAFLIIIGLLLIESSISDQEFTWTQGQSLPAWIHHCFKKNKVDEKYSFSSRVNPFYLRGDFNGDHEPDIAVLVNEKSSNKIGIAIFHFGKNEVFIVGAGEKCGNGGDNFRWMDAWHVYRKETVYQGMEDNPPPTLLGEALYVMETESASAIVYWNGEKYAWYQQGD